jgi:hypothetical protein
MDDELAEISIALKELISVPKQAFVTLPTQWYAGFDAGMHEEVIAADEA